MKIAFLSDIHGNAVALDTVLNDIEEQQVDRVVVIGDIAFRGPEPNRAIERIRALIDVRGRDVSVLKGNADEWVARGIKRGEVPDSVYELMTREVAWTQAQLSDEAVAWLGDLPVATEMRPSETVTVHVFHATPESYFPIIKPDVETRVLREQLMTHPTAAIVVYAHIHLPYVRYFDGRCLVNTGSVGLPFDGTPRSSYAIAEVEGDSWTVLHRRIPYDVERVVQLYRDVEYPNGAMMERVIRHGLPPR